MQQLLDLDAGNSLLKWRFRTGEHVISRGVCSYRDIDVLVPALKSADLHSVLVSCVADASVEIRLTEFLGRHAPEVPVRFAASMPAFVLGETRLINAYSNPASLGVDRWLAMIGALQVVRSNFCVVDCGTAITADFVDAGGSHLGGYIAPGLGLLVRALGAGTAKVRFDPQLCDAGPGSDTQACVAGGVINMFVGGVLAMLARHSFANLLVTGGDAPFLVQSMVSTGAYAPVHCEDLVLDGLKLHFA